MKSSICKINETMGFVKTLKMPVYSKEEESELFLDKEKNRDKILLHNFRLVISIAKRYHTDNLSQSDLIQEGFIGLMKAYSKFNRGENCRFISYATYYIKQAIIRAIDDKDRLIRLPANLLQAINRKSKRHPQQEKYIKNSLKYINELNLINLDDVVGVEGTNDFHNIVGFDNNDDEIYDMNLFKEYLEKLLNKLDIRSRNVIKLRFGFDDGEFKTYKKIGKICGLSHQTVGNIVNSSLDKIKHMIENSEVII